MPARYPLSRHSSPDIEEQLQRLWRAGWTITYDRRLDVYKITCKAGTMKEEIRRDNTQEVRDILFGFLARHARQHPGE